MVRALQDVCHALLAKERPAWVAHQPDNHLAIKRRDDRHEGAGEHAPELELLHPERASGDGAALGKSCPWTCVRFVRPLLLHSSKGGVPRRSSEPPAMRFLRLPPNLFRAMAHHAVADRVKFVFLRLENCLIDFSRNDHAIAFRTPLEERNVQAMPGRAATNGSSPTGGGEREHWDPLIAAATRHSAEANTSTRGLSRVSIQCVA